MKLRERIPHTWASYGENYLKSIFDSVSYWVVILRAPSHWSVGMVSCNFRLGGSLISQPITKHATHTAGEVTIN